MLHAANCLPLPALAPVPSQQRRRPTQSKQQQQQPPPPPANRLLRETRQETLFLAEGLPLRPPPTRTMTPKRRLRMEEEEEKAAATQRGLRRPTVVKPRKRSSSRYVQVFTRETYCFPAAATAAACLRVAAAALAVLCCFSPARPVRTNLLYASSNPEASRCIFFVLVSFVFPPMSNAIDSAKSFKGTLMS